MIACRTERRRIEGAEALIVAFEGTCVHDGNETMVALMGRVAAEHDVPAVIVDLRGMKPARCHCASSLRTAFEPSTVTIVPPLRGTNAFARAIQRDWDESLEQWLASDLDTAEQEIARRVRAGEHVVCRPDGSVSLHVRWTGRGTVVTSRLPSGEIFEALWVGRRRIEIVHRPRTAVVDWRKQWPFPDAEGRENEACGFQAYVRFRGSSVAELNFSPAMTGRPRSSRWLETLRSHPEVQTVELSGTETNDADVVKLMEACPDLVDLGLERTAITDASLGLILRARHLKRVHVKGCRLSHGKVEELGEVRPELWVDFDMGL